MIVHARAALIAGLAVRGPRVARPRAAHAQGGDEAGAAVSPRHSRAMLGLAAACIVVLALMLPATASADSIVYTKDHDVWLARPDGSGARQLTHDGGYQSPTQANDGTILVQRGTRFIRLDRAGRTLATLNSVMTGLPMGISAVGPFDPRISPDGTKLAYWIGMYSSWHDHRNNIDWNRTGPVTVWQDARDGRFLGATHSYEGPSWLPDSSGALLFEETNALTAQVVAAGVGADHNHIKQWFHDSDTKWSNEEYWKPIGAGEISRGMDRLAVLRGGTHIGAGGLSEGPGNTIALYDVHLPDVPTMECLLTGANGGEFGAPTWSPDGGSLAWAEGDGVWTGTIAHNCDGNPHLTIPGAREPDWGPADVGPTSAARPSDPGTSGSGVAVRAASAIGRHALQRRGLKVRVSCPSACRATATARQRGRLLARAARRLAGKGRLMLRPAHVRHGRLSVRVSVRPDGGVPVTLTRRVVVR
jgi:WD40-like Beta Propeller Repeat